MPATTEAKLEKYVQLLYQLLLDTATPGTVVMRRFDVQGATGSHNLDVYYEFTHVGLRHRVAFECKDWSKPVDIGEVRDFLTVLRDSQPLLGVIVAPAGFQRGPKISRKLTAFSL